jgi:hypothetical protein
MKLSSRSSLAVSLLPLAFAACGSNNTTDASTDVNLTSPDLTPVDANASVEIAGSPGEKAIPIKVRTIAGGPEQTAYLVDRLGSTTVEKVEDAVREADYPCSSVKGFYQLQQKGELIDVYKIDCGEGSYQLTAMNGETFFKPWSGNMIGSAE